MNELIADAESLQYYWMLFFRFKEKSDNAFNGLFAAHQI